MDDNKMSSENKGPALSQLSWLGLPFVSRRQGGTSRKGTSSITWTNSFSFLVLWNRGSKKTGNLCCFELTFNRGSKKINPWIKRNRIRVSFLGSKMVWLFEMLRGHENLFLFLKRTCIFTPNSIHHDYQLLFIFIKNNIIMEKGAGISCTGLKSNMKFTNGFLCWYFILCFMALSSAHFHHRPGVGSLTNADIRIGSVSRSP